jgi:hypothetical protein
MYNFERLQRMRLVVVQLPDVQDDPASADPHHCVSSNGPRAPRSFQADTHLQKAFAECQRRFAG